MFKISVVLLPLFTQTLVEISNGQDVFPFASGNCGDSGGDYCKIWGDPHVCMWDGMEHHFQGDQYADAPDNTIRRGYYYIDGYDTDVNTFTTGGTGLPFDVLGYHHPCGSMMCLAYLLVRLYDSNGALEYTVKMRSFVTADPSDARSMRIITAYSGGFPISQEEFIDGSQYARSLSGVGFFSSTVNSVGSLALYATFTDAGAAGTSHGATPACLPLGCENYHLIIELKQQSTNSPAHVAEIWLSTNHDGSTDGFAGYAYGLCGTNDNVPGTDFNSRAIDTPTTPAPTLMPGGRRLLQTQTVITYIDPENMQSWSNIVDSRNGNSDDAWEKTRVFGDSWAVDQPNYVNPNDLRPTPSRECVDAATTYCTSLWYDSSATDCYNCELFDRFNTNFAPWLEGCIFDTCIAAGDDGVNLEDVSLQQAVNAGYFDMAIGDCAASCQTIPGDCSDWTSWLDRDDPSDTGDWERIFDFELDGGSICDGGRPSGIECRSVDDGTDYADYDFDENIETRYCVADTGFLCVNGDGECPDFEVRFCCGEYVRDTSPYFECPEICTDLTSQFGCAGDQCLETCRNCITGIDWWDYAGGQNSNCQCHNNGCNLCPVGWWKVDYDFPCQSCADMEGCSHCTDFSGCQQCEQGYTMVQDDDCGEESHFNTNNQKVNYCVPI